MKDYHSILGVSPGASRDEIDKAYREMARKYHPDLNPDDPNAVEKFKEGAEAYDMLLHPEKIKPEHPAPGQPGFGFPGGFPGPFPSHMDDFFNSFYGNKKAQEVGEHIVLQVQIELRDVISGKEVDLMYEQSDLCSSCSGEGGSRQPCPECLGSGAKVIHGKAMTVKTQCPVCNGLGCTIGKPCDKCKGSGRGEAQVKTLKFNVPPGVESGMKFVHRGMGNPSRGRPGDLFIVVDVKEDDVFDRVENGDIICSVPISYTKLVLGADLGVPTLDGEIKMKVPVGTASGTKFRLKGLGLPNIRDRYRGDQLVKVDLFVPKDVSSEYRDLLEKLEQLEERQEN